MKRVLSVLGLIAFLGMSTPAFAAPGGPGGPPPGHGRPGGHAVHAGVHHRPHMGHRPHAGVSFHVGHPRHSYWYGYRGGYWRDPWCDYRLGWGHPYCSGFYPVGGTTFSIRF